MLALILLEKQGPHKRVHTVSTMILRDKGHPSYMLLMLQLGFMSE